MSMLQILPEDDKGMELLRSYTKIKNDALHFSFPDNHDQCWIYLFYYDRSTGSVKKMFLHYNDDGFYLRDSAYLKWKLTHENTIYTRICHYDIHTHVIHQVSFDDVLNSFKTPRKKALAVQYRLLHEPLAEHEKVYVYSYTASLGDVKIEKGRIFLPKSKIIKNNSNQWIIPAWLYHEKIKEIKLKTGFVNPQKIEHGKDAILVYDFAEEIKEK